MQFPQSSASSSEVILVLEVFIHEAEASHLYNSLLPKYEKCTEEWE